MTTEATDAGTAITNAGETTQTTAATDAAATTTPEDKGAANANPEAKDGETKGDGKTADAPVAYDFKLPEGVELDAGAADKFKAVAAKLELTPEGAQEVVDLYAGLKQQEAEAFEAQSQEWFDSLKTDKEFGGAKLDENLGIAKKALDQFGTPEIKSLLSSTRMGNHPEVVRLMVRIGKALSEDGVVRGKAQEGAPRDAASVLYGNPN